MTRAGTPKMVVSGSTKPCASEFAPKDFTKIHQHSVVSNRNVRVDNNMSTDPSLVGNDHCRCNATPYADFRSTVYDG